MKSSLALIAIIILTGAACGCTPSPAPRADPGTAHPGAARPGAAKPAVVTARCAGRTSDAATLQKAINGSAPGSLIQIQGPTCLLTRGIVYLDDRTYTGNSTSGTVLKQDGRMPYVLASQAYARNTRFTGNPVTIRDLAVTCSGSGTTDGIIVLNWQAVVESVDVTGCGGSGIVDTNTTANGNAISNTSVNSRFDDNSIAGSDQYGFETLDSGNSVTDGFFDANDISDSGLDAIHLQNAAGWDISANHLYADAENGIYADRLYGTTISNNYIEDFGSGKKSGTWSAITGIAQNGIGSTIFNNKLANDSGESPGARDVYLQVYAPSNGTGYLSVTGNVITADRPGDTGLSFPGSPAGLRVATAGNEIAGAGH